MPVANFMVGLVGLKEHGQSFGLDWRSSRKGRKDMLAIGRCFVVVVCCEVGTIWHS